MTGEARPDNVGILAAEVYFPSTYVTQEALELANGCRAGKYTIGLGQEAMAFTGDREDINSVCLTVLEGLLEKYDIDRASIGRLEVGTESLIDKSKSTKTVLMQLFESAGNTDVEGATVINACYGGTAALLNAVAWVESSGWDGRYACVVAADIAVYAEGPARPTGGCGAVAVLIGPNAPLPLNMKTRATHACDVWDFYKPNMDSEYPAVDGALSQTCYLAALDDCYNRLAGKSLPREGDKDAIFTASCVDHIVMHSPYNKLVQKSYARMLFNDAKRYAAAGKALPEHLQPLEPWLDAPREETYTDAGRGKGLEKALKGVIAKGVAAEAYKAQVEPGCRLSKQIGNTYTASVFCNLVCLVDAIGAALEGDRVLVFSYGSGALATMYEIKPRAPDAANGNGVSNSTAQAFSLQRIKEAVNLQPRLSSREELHPDELTAALSARAASHGIAPFTPTYPVDRLFPGTYYLSSINETYVREYTRRPAGAETRVVGGVLSPAPAVEEGSNGTTTSASEGSDVGGVVTSPGVSVVVSGVACGLPGQEEVFTEDNLSRLLKGQNCVTPLSDEVKNALLDKNVVQFKNCGVGRERVRIPIKQASDTIQLAARLGHVDVTKYGVTASIAATMDKAVQVAVAAGLEALKDAGIVTGKGENAWKLPPHMQETTGVVYATSFPAMDAAIGEVMRFLRSRCITSAERGCLIEALRERLKESSPNGKVSLQDEKALRNLQKAVVTKSAINLAALVEQANAEEEIEPQKYEFDRKFLFKVLVLGNGQLAQITGARGPNMQTNAACAGSTQALAMAQDMISVGRAERMIVIAGDNASGDALLPWVGNGFRALGACSISACVEDAALPFDVRRNGMLLGAGAIGMVLETEEAAVRRRCEANLPKEVPVAKARLLETQISNSAYHGAGMNKEHIADEMERFLRVVEAKHGITRAALAADGIYFSHETGTHASPSASCAYNEIYGLRRCFGDDLLKQLIIINTKGFTGHPMGVSFEDVAAVEVLCRAETPIPPTANLQQSDPFLGELNLSCGGPVNAKYGLRFAAGFGSQVALALYAAM